MMNKHSSMYGKQSQSLYILKYTGQVQFTTLDNGSIS
jgi:hypothetical protein